MKSMSLNEVAERLDDPLGLLTVGPRAAPRRHQTLRAAIDWSFDLLTEPERRLLRRLAIFSGGFSVDSVRQVVLRRGMSVRADRRPARPAREPLAPHCGHPTRALALRHARNHSAVQSRVSRAGRRSAHHSRAPPRLVSCPGRGRATGGVGRRQQTARLEPEMDNLRSALRWTIETRQVTAAARLALGMTNFWLNARLGVAPVRAPNAVGQRSACRAGRAPPRGAPPGRSTAGGQRGRAVHAGRSPIVRLRWLRTTAAAFSAFCQPTPTALAALPRAFPASEACVDSTQASSHLLPPVAAWRAQPRSQRPDRPGRRSRHPALGRSLGRCGVGGLVVALVAAGAGCSGGLGSGRERNRRRHAHAADRAGRDNRLLVVHGADARPSNRGAQERCVIVGRVPGEAQEKQLFSNASISGDTFSPLHWFWRHAAFA